jgi:hypothetical protein
MTKRNWFLIFIALAMAGVYAFYFTGWFKPKIIHISHISRVVRTRRLNPGFLGRLASLANGAAADSAVVPVTFKLERSYKLTELKVLNLDEWQTNKNCLPVWHLIADTNSVPINPMFTYGQNIPGMKSYVPGEFAEPLRPGVKYRLFVTDGSAKGEHDFQPVAAPPVQPAAPAK